MLVFQLYSVEGHVQQLVSTFVFCKLRIKDFLIFTHILSGIFLCLPMVDPIRKHTDMNCGGIIAVFDLVLVQVVKKSLVHNMRMFVRIARLFMKCHCDANNFVLALCF